MGSAAAALREADAEVVARVDQGIGKATQFGASLDAGMLRGAGNALPDGAHTRLDALAGQLDHAGEEANRRSQTVADGVRGQGHADADVIRDTTRTLASGTEHAAAQWGNFQHDAITGTGQLIGSGFDVTGQYVESATRHAPAAGAAAGAISGLSVASALELNAANYPRLFAAAAGLAQGKQAGAEAFERHLMRATVLPSMDSRIESAEQHAMQILARARAPALQDKSAVSSSLEDPSHPGHAMFQQARGGVHKLDTDMSRPSDQHSENLAGALTVAARAAGLNRIDIVALSEDGSRTFAVQHVIPWALAVNAHVETAQAVHTSLEQSSTEWTKAATQPTQPLLHSQEQAQQQAGNPFAQTGQPTQQQTETAIAMSR
jgi:hypothetical protein